MAVIHITEAEAARDLERILAKVRAGEEVRIGNDIAIVKTDRAISGKKTLSQAIELAEARQSNVTLDDQFARDLEMVISNHEHEGIRNPWED